MEDDGELREVLDVFVDIYGSVVYLWVEDGEERTMVFDVFVGGKEE